MKKILPELDESLITVRFPDDHGETVVLEGVSRSLHESVKFWAEAGKRDRWDIYREACKANGNSAEGVDRYMGEHFPC